MDKQVKSAKNNLVMFLAVVPTLIHKKHEDSTNYIEIAEPILFPIINIAVANMTQPANKKVGF